MKICRFFSVLLIGIVLSSTAGAAPTDKIEVKHAWPPGAYIMTQTTKSQGEQAVGNESMKTSSSETAVWELKVGEANDQGEKKIVAQVVKYKVKEEGDRPSAYDSEAPASQQQDKEKAFVYGALVGAPVEITLDPDDTVLEVGGLDKLWTKLAQTAATDGQKSLLAEVSLELGDKTVEQSLRRLESIISKKAVSVGEKWSTGVRSDLPLIGEVKERFDCTLQGIEESPTGKLAVVQLEGRYEATRPRPGKIQGQEVTVSRLEVVEKGLVKFDLNTGIATEDEKTLNISATIDATDEKGKPLRLTMQGSNEVRTTIIPAGRAVSQEKASVVPLTVGESQPPSAPSPQNGLEVQKLQQNIEPQSPEASSSNQKPLSQATSTPVNYVVHRYIDQGGIRDQATGEWLEAFRLLMPKGWEFQGGLRWVAQEKRPEQLTKTDILMPVRSDYTVSSPDSRCLLRSYPAEYWVDTSRTSVNMAGLGFKPGSRYNGMIVAPIMTPEQYIGNYVYPHQRGQMPNPAVISQGPLPRLAELYSVETSRFNQAMAAGAGQGSLNFKAGTLTIDYSDGATPIRETFVSVVQYIETAGMVMFWPRVNFSYRAPREEFDRWRPVFATIAASVQNNPRWAVQVTKITQNASISQQEIDKYSHQVQKEIAESHAATTSELARDIGYLSSPYHSYKGTDGNRYYLPTDKYHFMNTKGELLSQDSWSPPSSEWQSIEPYNQ